MNFILYIKCTEKEDFNYSNPFFEKLKQEIHDSDFLDLDNFSGAELLDAAIKALKSSEKSCVVFDLLSENESNRFLSLATWLVDHPEKSRVFINGSDPMINKLIFPLDNFSYHNISLQEQVKIIREFILNN